jgi:hypothetical protein
MSLELDFYITRMVERREQMRLLEAQLKDLKAEQNNDENIIFTALDELGVQKAGGTYGTVSISEEEVPTIDSEHWNDVWDYLFNNGYTELLRKQINATPWKELKNQGVEIPYVSTFTKRKLNLRAK